MHRTHTIAGSIWTLWVIPVLVVLGLAAPALGQNAIAMRSSVRLPADAEAASLTLGQIADIQGPDAAMLASITIHERVTDLTRPIAGGRQLDLEPIRVRETVLATPGVNAGRVSFTGGRCNVLYRDTGAMSGAGQPKAIKPNVAEPVNDQGTVRAAIRSKIAEHYHVPLDDLKLTFDATDRAALDASLAGAGKPRTLQCRLIGLGDRIPVSIVLYEGDQIILQDTVRVTAQIRKPVAYVIDTKRRGDVLGEADFTRSREWVPAGSNPANPDEILGWAVRSKVIPGKAIEQGDLEPPIAVRKGDLVVVDCVSNSLVLHTKGRALSDGKVGETIKLRSPKDKNQVFEARLAAKGRAVLVAGSMTGSRAVESTTTSDSSIKDAEKSAKRAARQADNASVNAKNASPETRRLELLRTALDLVKQP